MLVAITGAFGFIGRAVASRALSKGHDVLALTRRAVPSSAGLKVQCVSTYGEARPPLGGGILVHLAEERDMAAIQRAPAAYRAAQTEALKALLTAGWDHVVYVSSAAVYGDGLAAARLESDTPDPRNAYSELKLACETLAMSHGASVARLSNVYGPGMASNSVIGDMLAQIDTPGPLRLRDGQPVRDYLWVGDAADGLARMAAIRPRGPINLASGEAISVSGLARLFLEELGQPDRALALGAASGKVSHLEVSTELAQRSLGWQAGTRLRQGLAVLIGQYKS